MQVILLDKVANLGSLGDQVNVKAGYARNFLVPQGKAVPATKKNIEFFEARRAELEAKLAEKAQLEQKITEALAEIDRLKAQLKANRTSLKSVEKSIAKLETQKAEADAQAILKAQKSKLNSAIQNLLDAGVSVDDIIHKLNG